MESILNNIVTANNPGSLKLRETDYVEDSRFIDGIVNDHVAIYNACSYTPDTVGIEYPCGPESITHQDVEYLITRFGNRNTYMNTESLGNIVKENYATDMGVDEYDYQREYSLIKSGIHDEKYKPYMNKYLATIAAMETILDQATYNATDKLTKNQFEGQFPNMPTAKYTITKIDKELVDALHNPERNIELLKSKLQLNTDTGFYIDKNGIPYICMHEFMLYDGMSIKNMLEICADTNYCCKYCHSPLTFNLDANSIDFTPVQYRVIYLFIELLNMASYEEFINQAIIAAIAKSIEKLDLEQDNYVPMSEAFTATYVYKLFLYFDGKMKLLQTSTFIKFVNHIWNKSGWDEDTVNSLITNEERFIGFPHCCDLILAFQNTAKLTMETIVDILLRGMKDEGNPIQQLYLKDKSKLGEMTDLIIKSANNYIQTLQLKEIQNVDAKFKDPKIELFLSSGVQLKPLYLLCWKYICPVNGFHDMVKGTCKACGINESNVEKIFDKYEKDIQTMINPPTSKIPKQSTKSRDDVIAAINKAATTKPEVLPDILLTDKFNDQLRKKLEELLSRGHLDELPKTKENNCKILNYLLTTDIAPETIKLELDTLTTTSAGVQLIGVF